MKATSTAHAKATKTPRVEELREGYRFSVKSGDLLWIDGHWYVTHTGLIRLARRNRCAGIHAEVVSEFSDPTISRWAFKATVYKSRTCRGFMGFGDANPTNVSDLVRGAEMRVAETRAVNRALRKAYGIGICSVEDIGSFSAPAGATLQGVKKRPVQRVTAKGANGEPKLRDRLCQLIRQHQLDPVLVKSYALDFCHTKTLNEATREKIETFIAHLAERVTQNKSALICQLNSYLESPKQEGAA